MLVCMCGSEGVCANGGCGGHFCPPPTPPPCPETTELSLLSCFRGKLTVFTVLCEQYQPSLRRDPMYNEVRLRALGWAEGPPVEGGGAPARPSHVPRSVSTSTG